MYDPYNDFTRAKIREDLKEIHGLGLAVCEAATDCMTMLQTEPVDPDEWSGTMQTIVEAADKIRYIICEKKGRFTT